MAEETLLGLYTDAAFAIGPFVARVWDGAGTFKGIELTVTDGVGIVFWRTWEYGEVRLSEVKRLVGEWAAAWFSGWLQESNRLRLNQPFENKRPQAPAGYATGNLYHKINSKPR